MKSNNNSSIYNQSAVIPFRFVDKNLQCLLITSQRKKRWVIPKGIIESNLTASDSAAKEAFEEAGIKGKIYPEIIGNYQYQKWGGTCHVKIYLLEVSEVFSQWEEAHFRERQWVTVEQAIQRIEETELKKIFKKLPKTIKKVTGKSNKQE